MGDALRFLPAGDTALVVVLGDAIDSDVNRRVHDLARAVEEQGIAGIVDIVPAYLSLLVQYDPMQIGASALEDMLSQIESGSEERPPPPSRVVHIPTLYGGEYGPDLDFVAEHAGLTPDDVVGLHSRRDYLVYMMGFTPGFPYLGGLAEEISAPRLDSPRAAIPAGSVGIAESQTGVYPVESPGGWRLIGRTPLALFDPQRDPPSLISAGEHIRFVPLSGEQEYMRTLDLVRRGEYTLATEVR